MTIAELLNAKEGKNVEFKEAKNSFKFDTLVKYACAVFNHGGGRVVFGITNKRSISKTGKAKKGKQSHIIWDCVSTKNARKRIEKESEITTETYLQAKFLKDQKSFFHLVFVSDYFPTNDFTSKYFNKTKSYASTKASTPHLQLRFIHFNTRTD